MIPILYGSVQIAFADSQGYIYVDADGKVFTKNQALDDYATLGSGALGEAISCKVTEARNGKYELFMTYPFNGIRYGDICEGAVIKATPSKGRQPDYFRIYSITKPINGIIEIRAEHISYQLSHIPVMPFTASNCAGALNGLYNHSAEPNPFTFWTDKVTVATYTQTVPASCRSRLGGVQGSILDVYGGEYEFDRFDVKLWANRGADRGVQLRYGKNITDLTQESNIANVVTGVCPFWADDDGNVVTLPEEVISSPKANAYPYARTIVKDFSSDFQSQPTVAQLRAKAQAYVESDDIGVPKVSIKVKFVDLSQTDDYSSIALLETVKLCDTVTVIFEPFGIDAKSKVVETVWDVLKDRYESITLGTVKANLASIVAQNEKDAAEAVEDTRSILANEIAYATDQITGSDGGYVVINRDADGNPKELLVMNTPDINTATRVWRWNQDGLGVSNNGYNGPYESAMTADGHFVANFITAGTMIANLIKAGVLSDTAGNFYLDMDDGTLVMQNGTFNGTIVSNNATITGGSIYIETNSATVDKITLSYDNGSSEYTLASNPGGTTASRYSSGFGTATGTFSPGSALFEYVWESDGSGDYGAYGDYGFAHYSRPDDQTAWVKRTDFNLNTGLKFYNSSGTETANYPATGLYKLTPQALTFTDNNPATGLVINVPFLTASDLGVSNNASHADAIGAWLKWICSHYRNKQTCIFEGVIQFNSYRMVRGYIYQTNTVNSAGLPQYSSTQMQIYDGSIIVNGTNNYNVYTKYVSGTV